MSAGTKFCLVPFPGTSAVPEIEILGTLSLCAGRLDLEYTLSGAVEKIAIPERAENPTRIKGLWEETCLEFFIRQGDSRNYWEFNLSPAGHWNVFAFSGYREDMREEQAFSALPFTTEKSPVSFSLRLEADLGAIFPPSGTLFFAVTAVIKAVSGESSYWALSHNGPKPDFHRPEDFGIELT